MTDKPVILILHHDDDDGRCAAAIAAGSYGDDSFDIRFLAVNYGKEEYDQVILKEAQTIWMVDFTSNVMETFVSEYGYKLIWIDHHKTAMEKYPSIWNSNDIAGIRSLDKAGCELTWDYCSNEATPFAVQLIGDRDMWEFEYPETKMFCAGVSALIKTPYDSIWFDLLTDKVSAIYSIMQAGTILLESQMYRVEKVFDRGIDIIFHGYNARLVNTTTDISEVGEYIYQKPEYDLAIMWQAINDMLVFSLRSNSKDSNAPDCSLIAQKYGGGGHFYAAGFSINNVNFTTPLGLI